MTILNVVNVFADAARAFGNPLGVFLDGQAIPERRRQPIAARLGFSESVYIDDQERGALRIYTPAIELPFAGHAVVGAAWLLERQGGHRPERLRTPAGDVLTWTEGDLVWVRGKLEWCPPWDHVEATSAAEVAAATTAPPGSDAVQLWAFEDEAAGLVRARVFADRFGVAEDEACGSASQLLAAKIGRPLRITHGNGSEIFVRPQPDGTVDLGGRVKPVSARDFVDEDPDRCQSGPPSAMQPRRQGADHHLVGEPRWGAEMRSCCN
jgi:predicted PhzF superfamily epimerase YddE/YHI9